MFMRTSVARHQPNRRAKVLDTAQRRLWHWRLRMQRRWWNATFHTVARLGDGMLTRQARREAVEVIRNVRYGTHPVAHRLDIYRPRERGEPRPVMLYIHGGAFTVCSKETHRGIALLKAAHPGYLVFNINYRLAPKYPFPAAIEDACAAYLWVVQNAARYGGDPQRIVVAGESAGGNLALGVAIAATYRRPEPYARAVYDRGVVPTAVMPIVPYLQTSDPQRRERFGYWSAGVARDIAQIYLGHTGPGTDETLMADPIRVLEECGRPRRKFPRVLSGVGMLDMCSSDVRRLAAACRRLGIDARVRYYAGEIHAFHVLRWRSAARRFWHEMFTFMQQVAVKTAKASARVPRRLRVAARRRTRAHPKVRRALTALAPT
jgi:acetyl esterase